MESLKLSWPKVTYDLIKDIVDKALLKRRTLFSNLSYFSNLTNNEIEELVLTSKLSHYDENEIISKGSDSIVIILDGFIEKFAILDGGWEASISILSKEDIFNIESMYGRNSRVIYKASISNVSTLEISRKNLLKILEKCPKLYESFLNVLANEQNKMQDMYLLTII